ESMVGRPVGELRYAIYAARSLLPRRGSAEPVLQDLPWIGFDDRIAYTGIAQWFGKALPEVRPRMKSDSLPAMLKAAAAGIGAVVLPMFAAAQEPGLLRITPPIEGQSMGLWLLHHPDVRGNARVRLLMQWLAEAVPKELAQQAEGGKAWPCFA